MQGLLCADLLMDISLEQTYLIRLGHNMNTPLTKQILESIIAEERQKIHDDLCDKEKHALGKHSKLIGTGLRLCDIETHKDFYVVKRVIKKGNEFFILKDSEGNMQEPINAKDLLKSYRLD